MIGSIVLLIVVGVLLEGLPSLNVLAPLLIPIAGKLGLSELHYALVLIIAMGDRRLHAARRRRLLCLLRRHALRHRDAPRARCCPISSC